MHAAGQDHLDVGRAARTGDEDEVATGGQVAEVVNGEEGGHRGPDGGARQESDVERRQEGYRNMGHRPWKTMKAYKNRTLGQANRGNKIVKNEA